MRPGVAHGQKGRIMLKESNVEKFKASLRGELIQRTDSHYEQARQLCIMQ